ncbi:hypothetical protein DSCO28_19920 [Desulfosarcina ovata subsp. sediminis]|uniref:Uncharacterized protein n=1 Tax=Desulfosarcina ovata subsp. sediminis TaxID=885957 RepID=A0A5K7ZK67_9BACT|nr:hypothetical protein [Desulfosarcina ovata]BBO81426.1 hypothetical protein DSCO28_19920 [Desulfosarcina ovata subsp. sediminis]
MDRSKALNLSEEKYRYLVQNSDEMIYTLDVDGYTLKTMGKYRIQTNQLG